MKTQHTIIINASNEQAHNLVLREKILLSSYGAGWNGINLIFHKQPPLETPEYKSLQHSIAIPACNVEEVEENIDGKLSVSSFSKGQITVTPANHTCKYRWSSNIVGMTLFLEPDIISTVVHSTVDPSQIEIVPNFVNYDPLVYQIGHSLKRELETNFEGSSLYAESASIFLAAHLIRNYSTHNDLLKPREKGLPPKKLNKTLDYIHSNLSEDLTLNTLSHLLGMSPYYFCRLFKCSIGITPRQYIIQKRVEKAKHLLSYGNLELAHIALECGFANQGHFCRHFKKLTGVTPRQFKDL